jgi:hypothetical protein
MLGNFQKSHLRIEIEASKTTLRDSLLNTDKLRQWLYPQTLTVGMPDKLSSGLTFSSNLALITVEHYVEIANDNCLRLILSKGIDGYHEWYWGDGWIQSCLEGVSLLPLNLGQTFNLLRLRQLVAGQKPTQKINS